MARGTRTQREISRSSAVRTKVAMGGAIPQPPVATTAPLITGTPTVGQTLTATPGVYTAGGTLVRRQWLRNGEPITGATALTYVLVAADAGKRIAVSEKMANAVGYEVCWSAFTAEVAAA